MFRYVFHRPAILYEREKKNHSFSHNFHRFYCSSIQNYDKHYSSTGGFETNAFFKAVGDFGRIFTLSLIIGAAMGCITALMTKFTRIRDFPLLESALFVLMSYSTFLIAEATELTGPYATIEKKKRNTTNTVFELR